MKKILPDIQLTLEFFKLFIICFVFGMLTYRIFRIENILNNSYKKVKATKQYLFYFDNKNHLEKCETLYWFLQEK